MPNLGIPYPTPSYIFSVVGPLWLQKCTPPETPQVVNYKINDKNGGEQEAAKHLHVCSQLPTSTTLRKWKPQITGPSQI